MLILQDISYTHPDKLLLFSGIHLQLAKGEKAALIGHNGVGKSTLLKLIAGVAEPASGSIQCQGKVYYLPQILGQFNHLTVSEALGASQKLIALHAILAGETDDIHYQTLDDDWQIEERCREALDKWGLHHIGLTHKLEGMSGGEKTRVFLAGIGIHQPDLVVMDEPSNHLDAGGRAMLYQFVENHPSAILLVSHDRTLLNLVQKIFELTPAGIGIYGGNFEFYTDQKQQEVDSIQRNIQSKEKTLRDARQKERETIERQQKLNSRGKGKKQKEGVAKIMMNTLRNNAENTSSRLQASHSEKVDGINDELRSLKKSLFDPGQMKLGFEDSGLHKGKQLIRAERINCDYGQGQLWEEDLSFEIISGRRYAIRGANGSGKTSLIKMIMGELPPGKGDLIRLPGKSVYVDQEYSLLDNKKQVYEQAQDFNQASLAEHDVKIRLHRFLFERDEWTKLTSALSGGERMRLMLCCLSMAKEAPDILILDEPTNNLDLQNLEILTTAINDYKGTLLLVSHDAIFLEELGVNHFIDL